MNPLLSTSIEWLPVPDDYPKGVVFVSRCKLYIGVTYEFLDELQRLRDENKRLREENLLMLQEFTKKAMESIDKAKKEYYETLDSILTKEEKEEHDNPYIESEYNIEYEDDPDFT